MHRPAAIRASRSKRKAITQAPRRGLFCQHATHSKGIPFSNGRTEFKRPFETPPSRKQGGFVILLSDRRAAAYAQCAVAVISRARAPAKGSCATKIVVNFIQISPR
jgi:hypothetical protein